MGEENNAAILGLIKQYLEYYQYNRALDALKVDVAQSGERFGPVPDNVSDDVSSDLNQNELLALFDEGEVSEYFRLWRSNVPKESQLCDKECIVMTFQLHLHFLVYPLRGNTQMAKFRERHTMFVKYLEDVASQHEVIVNSSLARFLCLGLASIATNPLENRMIKEILQPSWSNALRSRLIALLGRILKGTAKPHLFLLYEGSKKSIEVDIEKKLEQSEGKCIQYKGLYAQQQREYYNVLSVATELVESLENAILGKDIDPKTIERVCTQLFQQPDPSHSLQLDFTRPGTASNLLRQSVVKQEITMLQEPPPHASLDFAKIKRSIESGDEKRVCYLLQAVRWRITKAETDIEREEIVDSFISEDLFGVFGPESYTNCIISMLSSTNTILQENIARLINVLSALTKGYHYLYKHQTLIQEMIITMLNIEEDCLGRQAVLGALQKMSLKRAVQTNMLTSDLIEWLLNCLSEPDDLTEYSLHHSCALLMNLCLRTKGRRYISEDTTRLLHVIEGLLEHEQLLVREYINGILFSALNMKSVRDKANDMGLDESLKLLITVSQEEMSCQLQYCLDQLVNPSQDTDPQDGDSDEEDDIVEDSLDSLVMDLQLPESIIGPDNDLSGEKLLCTEYLGDIKLKLPDTNQVSRAQRQVVTTDEFMAPPEKMARTPPPLALVTQKQMTPDTGQKTLTSIPQDMTPQSVPHVSDEVDPNIPWDERPIRPAANQHYDSQGYGP